MKKLTSDEKFMKAALREARKAYRIGEIREGEEKIEIC